MTTHNGYEVEGQLQFVSDAVLAFAYAIRDMQRQLCPGQNGICPRMASADGSELLQHLKTAQFKGKFTTNIFQSLTFLLFFMKQKKQISQEFFYFQNFFLSNFKLSLNRKI